MLCPATSSGRGGVACASQRRTVARQGVLRLLGPEVDSDLQDLDGAVGNQLSGDRDGVDENAGADQDSIVRAPRDELRKFVEAGGECVDDGKEIDRQEIVGRRSAVLAAFGPAMCCSTSSLRRATRFCGASSRSQMMLSSKIACCSARVMCSSSAAVQIFRGMPSAYLRPATIIPGMPSSIASVGCEASIDNDCVHASSAA